jgi:hypothetical protein
MAETIQCKAWILVDSCGDYAIGGCEQAARDEYENNIQDLNECDGFRLYQISLTVPLPSVVELTGEVPAEADGAKLSVL